MTIVVLHVCGTAAHTALKKIADEACSLRIPGVTERKSSYVSTP